MRNRLPPLRSNDLFGGVPLGQHAERIQAAQPFKIRRHCPSNNHAELYSKKRGAIAPTKHAPFVSRRELNHATFDARNCSPTTSRTFDFSDTLEYKTSYHQTGNIVGQLAAERLS
jgi:hypothetical protein